MALRGNAGGLFFGPSVAAIEGQLRDPVGALAVIHTRRLILAGLLATAATPILAAGRKLVDVGKVFPYLENYWKLPAAERSRFTVAYYLQRDGKPASGVKAAVVQGATRTPIGVGAGGRVSPLPTLAQIRSGAKIEFDVANDVRFSMNLTIEPLMRPAAELNAGDLALSVTQAAKGARKVAGLMGMAMPAITAVHFKGAAGGQVIDVTGRAVALPVAGGAPVFEPSKHPGARTVKFSRAPTQMTLGPAKPA
jgi:hypothetical protein